MTTFDPSRLNDCGQTEFPWTSFAAASPAPTSASPERAQASPGHSPACGPSSPGSLASYDPDTHSLKTWQLSLAEDWSGSSVTLPRSGSMRNGELFPQPTWAPRTAASAYGLLPTPVAKDDGKSFEAHMAMKERMGRNTCSSLAVMARSGMWPTPTATLGTSQTAPWKPGVQWWLQSRAARHLEALVQHPERMWQTPVADDAMDRVAGKLNSRGEPKLSAQVKLWPTPQAHDATPGNASRVGRYGTEHGGRNLNDWVAMWPTPRSGQGMVSQLRTPEAIEKAGGHKSRLEDAVAMWPTPASRDYRSPSLKVGTEDYFRAPTAGLPLNDAVGGALNPPFVEWLLGIPKDWTKVG